MPDLEALDRRLQAVERTLTDGEHDLEALWDAGALLDRIESLEAAVDAVDDRLDELEAATQAVRGYVGNVRSVNADVEERADAALAAVERLESRLDVGPACEETGDVVAGPDVESDSGAPDGEPGPGAPDGAPDPGAPDGEPGPGAPNGEPGPDGPDVAPGAVAAHPVPRVDDTDAGSGSSGSHPSTGCGDRPWSESDAAAPADDRAPSARERQRTVRDRAGVSRDDAAGPGRGPRDEGGVPPADPSARARAQLSSWARRSPSGRGGPRGEDRCPCRRRSFRGESEPESTEGDGIVDAIRGLVE